MATSNSSFLDTLIGIFQDAIAAVQYSSQLKAENAQLTAENAQLTSQLNAITSSLSADEQEKADTATKLAALEQVVSQYQSATTPSTTDPSTATTTTVPATAATPSTTDPSTSATATATAA